MNRFAFGLLLCAAPAFAAPVPKVKPVVLDGTWQMTENDFYGPRTPDDLWTLWVIAGGKLYVVRDRDMLKRLNDGEKTEAVAFEIRFPDAKDSSAFDLVQTAGKPGDEKVYAGRLELKDDRLTLCYPVSASEKRPAGCRRADGLSWNAFKRVGDPKTTAK